MAVRFQQDIELNENWEPVVGKKQEIIRRFLPYLAAISTYFLFLNLSFWFSSVLMHSPIVNAAGAVFAFLIVVVSWLVAFCIFGLFGGNFSFANQVFLLIKQADFRAGFAVLFAGFFFSRILAGVLRRIEIPYSARIGLFFVVLFSVFSTSACFLTA